MKKRLISAVLGMSVAGLLLAGCGGNNAAQAPAAAPAANEPAAQEEPAAAEEAAVEETATEEAATEEAATEEAAAEDAAAAEAPAEIDYSDPAVLAQIFPNGYLGVGDDGTSFAWAVTADLSAGIMVMTGQEGQVALAGPLVDNGDGSITITDAATGNAMTVYTEAVVNDEGETLLQFTSPDGDVALLAPCTGQEVIDLFMQMQ